MKFIPKLFPKSKIFLQISPKRDGFLYFKCLGCKHIFNLGDDANWNFCPNCGSRIQVIRQTIKSKQYFDDFGEKILIDGNWRVVRRAPLFTLTMEFPSFEKADEWTKYDYFPQTGDHDTLKRYIKTYNPCDRIRIIPSKPLPLL